MRVGMLADAHGNPLGLDLCLRALRREGVDELRFLGDAVGYMPGAPAVLEALERTGAACQKGNHEAMLLGDLPLPAGLDEAYRLRDTASKLKSSQLGTIAGWPVSCRASMDGRDVLLVHGSPTAPLTDYIYPDTRLERFSRLGFDAVFMANTHRPFVRRSGPTLFVNVGSCGLPRDQGDHAACVVYDTSTGRCDLIRVPMPPCAVLAQFDPADIHPLVGRTLHRQAGAFQGRIVEAV